MMVTFVVCLSVGSLLAAVAYWHLVLEQKLEKSICPICGDACDGLAALYSPDAPYGIQLACERCEAVLSRRMA
jgi:hypothetical protein